MPKSRRETRERANAPVSQRSGQCWPTSVPAFVRNVLSSRLEAVRRSFPSSSKRFSRCFKKVSETIVQQTGPSPGQRVRRRRGYSNEMEQGSPKSSLTNAAAATTTATKSPPPPRPGRPPRRASALLSAPPLHYLPAARAAEAQNHRLPSSSSGRLTQRTVRSRRRKHQKHY